MSVSKKGPTRADEQKISSSELSCSLAKSFEIARAITGDNYDPTQIDRWFSEQRKRSKEFSRKFIATS